MVGTGIVINSGISLLGVVVGAFITTLFQYFFKKVRSKEIAFSKCLEIQNSLQQILNDTLNIYSDYLQYRKIWITEHYPKLSPKSDPQNLWDQYKAIDWKKFDYSKQNIELDWDFSPLLFKVEGRNLLTPLRQTKVVFLQFARLLNDRNVMLNDALIKLKDDYEIYQPGKLDNILGKKAWFELQDITDQLIGRIKYAIYYSDNEFKNISEYIKQTYKSWHRWFGCKNTYQPLVIGIPDDIATIIKDIKKELDKE